MPRSLQQSVITSILDESEDDDSPPSAKSTKITVFDEKSKKSFSVSKNVIPEKDQVLFASTTIRIRGDHHQNVRVIGIGGKKR